MRYNIFNGKVTALNHRRDSIRKRFLPFYGLMLFVVLVAAQMKKRQFTYMITIQMSSRSLSASWRKIKYKWCRLFLIIRGLKMVLRFGPKWKNLSWSQSFSNPPHLRCSSGPIGGGVVNTRRRGVSSGSSCDALFTEHAHDGLPFSSAAESNPQSLAPSSFLRRQKDCKMVCNLSQYVPVCISKTYMLCCVPSDVSKHSPDVQMKLDSAMLRLSRVSLNVA